MQRILSTYSPISLDEMQGIKLMNRIDTKFVTTTGVLSQLLLMANGAYRVQEIGGERNMRYNTTYLDTPDYQMFYAHQWGHANRQKVRFRNLLTGCERELVNLVVIELKRDGLCYSPVLEMLRRLRVQPHGFSKYCIGSALTNYDLRINRFKPRLMEVHRINGCA